MFELQALPYSEDALTPYISKNTVHYHYHKHHNGYVDKLNKALSTADEKTQAMTLEQLITETDGKLYNLAAQVWNHNFYWQSMHPKGGGQTNSDLLTEHFGSTGAFLEAFKSAASGEFGSGWAWLVKNKDGSLAVTSTTDAVNPLSNGQQPLLTIDVWEHAYYLDYQNKRADYIDKFVAHLLNWEFLEKNLKNS
jgi:Fe-Mn family superoxide dismutase